jgi:hypothetical protein
MSSKDLGVQLDVCREADKAVPPRTQRTTKEKRLQALLGQKGLLNTVVAEDGDEDARMLLTILKSIQVW